MDNNTQTLEEILKEKYSKDPFWGELILKYFKEEEQVTDYVGKLIFKDLSEYDDILNEFTKYLLKKSYDLEDTLEIEGYTAKDIHEINPTLKPCGVYTFMASLRSNPDKAKETIKNGFPTK